MGHSASEAMVHLGGKPSTDLDLSLKSSLAAVFLLVRSDSKLLKGRRIPVRGPKRMRVDDLVSAMTAQGLDGVVAVMPENVYYITDPLIYTSWTLRERLALVVFPNGGQPTLIVSSAEESWVRDDTWIEDLRLYAEPAQSPINVLADVLSEKGLGDKTIGIELTYLAAAYYARLKEHLPKINLVSSETLFDVLRAVKSPEEVAHLKHAANVTEQAIYEAFADAHLGHTEQEVVDQMNARLLLLGADENAFCMVGGGRNSLVTRHSADSRRLVKGAVFSVDIGARFAGYYGDVARTAIGGSPTPKQRDTYMRLREAQRSTIDQMRPGVRACDVYDHCLKAFEERGLTLTMRFLGHGIGIFVHEHPIIEPGNETQLKSGMMINVEPGYEEAGVGRYALEDLVLVTPGSPIVMSDYSETEEMFSIN